MMSPLGLALVLGMAAASPGGDADLRARLARMSDAEKVGQVVFPEVKVVKAAESLAEVAPLVDEQHIGGLHVFGRQADEVERFLQALQARAKVPLLITADLEGGVGYAFRGATRVPQAMALAASGRERNAHDAARITSEEGRALGVGVNFYPVADVNNNPDNPIINVRSFGEDPAAVARFVGAYVEGAQEAGLLACAKHFPGHGDTKKDSHLTLPVIDVDRDRLERVELVPFRAAIRAGVGCVMTAHLAVPAVEPDTNVPATLSRAISTGLLRERLGFDGLIVTDAMKMRGVTAHYESGDAAVRALAAGADVVLMPADVNAALTAVRGALSNGTLDRRRLDDAVLRVLRAKHRLGLLDDPRPTGGVVERAKKNRARAEQMFSEAMTLVRDDDDVVPLSLAGKRVVQLDLTDKWAWGEDHAGVAFYAALRKRSPRAVRVTVRAETVSEDLARAYKVLRRADIVFVNAYVRVAASSGRISLEPGQLKLLRDVSRGPTTSVTTVFGSPYLPMAVKEPRVYLLAYDFNKHAEAAALKALLGEAAITGRLPVTLPGTFERGHGLKRDAAKGSRAQRRREERDLPHGDKRRHR
jgi:beta-N-acetylhexosaminidase